MRALWVALIAVACTTGVQANPVMEAARAMGKNGFATGAPPSASPTQFKPNGKRVFIASYAKALGDTEAERKSLEGALTEVVEAFDKASQEAGVGNDVSSAMAFSITLLTSLTRGEEFDDETWRALNKRLQATFDTPEVRKATDVQKQEAYEWALCSSGLVVAVLSAAESDADKARAIEIAKAQIEALTGAKPDQFSKKGKELVLKVVAAAPVETPKSVDGFAPNFGYDFPKGWVNKAPWLVYAERDGTTTVAAHIRFLKAVPATGNMGDALRKAWKESVPPALTDAAGSMVYRRYVGNKLFTQFIFGKGREPGNQADSVYTLYLVDCGAMWQPVIVAQTYVDDSPYSGGVSFSAQFSWGKSADFAELALATIRCEGAPNQALVTKESIAGQYSYGGGGTQQWENIYTGATSMTFISSSGTLNLGADGAFTYTFTSANGAVGATVFRGAKGAGTYTIEGDILICKYTSYDQGDGYKRTEERYRIAGLTRFADGVQIAVLFDDLKLPVNNVSIGHGGTWYTTKK